MGSDSVQLPGREEAFPASEKRGAGGDGSTTVESNTASSGDSGSGSKSFLVSYWWRALLACLPLAFFLAIGSRFRTWPLYLLSEISSVALGIFVAACWIRHDRAKVQSSTEEGKGGLDQLGFFNSRLAKRNPKLFEIATKELMSEVPEERRQPATTMVARYWEIKDKRGGNSSSDPTTNNGAGKKPGADNDDELMKILQPEYAIGMGVITRDDYNNEMNQYFAQSELSLGLIVPMILIVLGLRLIPEVGLNGGAWVAMCLALAPISGVLFVVGMERWQKYRMELKLLILGNWEKLQDAKKQQKPPGNGGSLSKPVQDAVVKAIDASAKGASNLNVDIKLKP
jgi:hypothetical protein